MQIYLLIFKALSWLALPGTIIHEAGHYIGCKVFGIGVAEVKWFNWRYMFDRKSTYHDNVIGYVMHEPVRSMTKHFIISTGPLWFGGTLWVLSMFSIHYMFEYDVLQGHDARILLIVGLFWLMFASSFSMLPSSQDMRNVVNHSPSVFNFPIYLIAWIIFGIDKAFYRRVRWLMGNSLWEFIVLIFTLLFFLWFSIEGGREAMLEAYTDLREVVTESVEYINQEFQ